MLSSTNDVQLSRTSQPQSRPHILPFFLHVYHAKVDNQNSALLYIQEAIFLARLLKLDQEDGSYHREDSENVVDGCVVYLLLWISER
jgi:hypothetical protein